MEIMNAGKPTAPLSTLQAAVMSDLKVGEVAQGRVLYGMVCGPFIRMSSGAIFTLHQEGGHKIKCVVFRVFTMFGEEGSAKQAFPLGARVAIKEPMVQAQNTVVVPFPASVEFVGVVNSQGLSAHGLRMRGNREYGDGNFTMADCYYTECLNSTVVTTDEERLLALSNRAGARFKQGNIDGAMVDAEAALDLNPFHLKGLTWMAKALMESQEHQRALSFLQLALEHAPGAMEAAEVQALIERCEVLLKQGLDGNYDLTEFFMAGLNPRVAPKVSDFVGPVEVCFEPDGRLDKGLVVTRDVKMGDLLLVSNAIAFATLKNERTPGQVLQDGITEAVRKCGGSSRLYSQLFYLAKTVQEVDMDAYRPNSGFAHPKASDFRSLDVEKVNTIYQEAVREGRLTYRIGPGQIRYRNGGLWGLPCLMDTSCLPNVSVLRVGDALFVRAAKDMKAGEKMFGVGVNMLSPLVSRRKYLRCDVHSACHQKCRRCEIEATLDEKLNETAFVRKYPDDAHTLTLGECLSSIAQLEAAVEIGGLSQEEKGWILGGYVNAYYLSGTLGIEEMLRMIRIVAPGRS